MRDDGEWRIDIPLTPVERSEYESRSVFGEVGQGMFAAWWRLVPALHADVCICLPLCRRHAIEQAEVGTRQLEIEQAEHDAQSIRNEKP